jgi:hypothetical protein
VPIRKGQWIVDRRRTVLDLCGGTGSWSAPWRQHGYEVYVVDPDPILEPTFCMTVHEFRWKLLAGIIYLPPVDIILAAPPCTHFTNASAGLWAKYDQQGLTDVSMGIVYTCLELVDRLAPRLWALENPRGRLAALLGRRPSWHFQPYFYGDPWKKETLIWGNAKRPDPTNVVKPLKISPNARLGGKSAKVKTERSRTPHGFASAFAAVNART